MRGFERLPSHVDKKERLLHDAIWDTCAGQSMIIAAAIRELIEAMIQDYDEDRCEEAWERRQ